MVVLRYITGDLCLFPWTSTDAGQESSAGTPVLLESTYALAAVTNL